jgi:hypothetical protein
VERGYPGFHFFNGSRQSFDRQGVGKLSYEAPELMNARLKIFALLAHKLTAGIRRELALLSVTDASEHSMPVMQSYLADLTFVAQQIVSRAAGAVR